MPGPGCERTSVENALVRLIEKFEQDRSLNEPRNLRQRFEALDDLDAYLLDGQAIRAAVRHRATAIYDEMESVNLRLYDHMRRDIQRGSGADRLLEWMPDWNAAANLMDHSGYDYLDELISGALQFEEPLAEVVPLKR
jgi:hypothetical protein